MVKACFAFCALVFVGIVAIGVAENGMNDKLDSIVLWTQKKGNATMPTRTTKWKSATGEQEIVTTKEVGETSSHWAQRHKAEVLAAQVEDPIIP